MTNIEQQCQNEIIQTINVQLLPEISIALFKEKLSSYINDLINRDFGRLISILYRLDVSEKKLRQTLATSSTDAGELITEMIIQRQMQKINTRRQFYQRKEDIPDEERW
jgi:hypothetical protein